MKDFGYLALAILAEVTATMTLKATESFTKPIPTLIVFVGYIAAFYFFSVCMNTINAAIAYAIWSGVGIILVTFLGWLIYDQAIDLPGLCGIGLILLGVIVLNLFSKTVTY